jgi:NAD-dependent SIR2 family protein deacetylase
MKKKVVILSGAGISKESGINTFRDLSSGSFYNQFSTVDRN